ncbi:hypothetical protein QBC47DRAFT_330971 [Echria macrotheca]|uniref:C2H2-type domain-containing protein n=1 Tax=Echria macrotheca TaxID=438768 RepID=A0AAJ0B397_9PEZI|nr:hypothetical protein QBC47DRAFT_330971 [Echria macrotheca]
MATESQALGPIARSVRRLFDAFAPLRTPEVHELSRALEDELTRFKMWAGNLGAHQHGASSLDYRLREAPHLRDQVNYLLQDAIDTVEHAAVVAQDILTREGPAHVSREPLSQPTFPATSNPSRDGDDGQTTDSDEDDVPSPEQRFATLQTDFAEIIDCLLRLSVAIANPAPYDRFRKFQGAPSEDISYREVYDIAHVRDKCPGASQEVCEILGKAITRRRQFFRYRRDHHEKLAAGLDATTVEEGNDARSEIVAKTIASSIPEPMKTMTENLDRYGQVIDEDNHSETAGSVTSYATSAGLALRGMEVGNVDNLPPPLRVPELPTANANGIFECPFCFRMISAPTRQAWKRHVFGDLRPYTCLFEDCVLSNSEFDRRSSWRAHMLQHHLRAWYCPYKCKGARFSSPAELRSHLRAQHLPHEPEAQLNTIAAVGEGYLPEDEARKCPICTVELAGLRLYTKHLGRHLEQLALFALPDLDNQSDKRAEDSGSDSQSSGDPLPGLAGLALDDDSGRQGKKVDSSEMEQTPRETSPTRAVPGWPPWEPEDEEEKTHDNSQARLEHDRELREQKDKHRKTDMKPAEDEGRPHNPATLAKEDPTLSTDPDRDSAAAAAFAPTVTEHGSQIRHPKTKSKSRELSMWFCCHCGYGPHNMDLYDGCIMCQALRCRDCHVERHHNRWD